MTATPVVRISAAVALVGLLGLAISASFLHRTVEQLRSDQALIKQRDVIAKAFEQLLKDLQETEAQRAALYALRPESDRLVRFVEGLEAASSGAFIDQEIAAIPPESDQAGQPYASPVVRYRITLEGTAEKIEAYLRLLASLPELVRIERIELRSPPDGHVVANAQAELVLAVAVKGVK